jgi:high affinity sulfate transporter 1
MSHPSSPSGLARFLPILSWVPRYQRMWLRPDLIAGITVAALVVPKSLGYAGIAGVPIEYGLYAAAAGAILYAIFGLSGQIATGPSSALAAVAAGALVSAGIATGSGDAVALIAAVTIASGLMFLVLRLFRMGWISQFLSKPVITGFLFGAAIEVVIGELPKITGTSAEGTNSWQKLLSWVEGLSATDLTTVAVGVASLVLIFGLKVAAPRLPGALVLLVLGLAASIVLGLGEQGVTLIGEVPRGLPSVAFPELDFVGQNITVILTAAVGLLLIGFSQTASDARSFASKHGARVDIDQESVAQGAANIGSGLLQGIPVSTSLSASSLADSSGAKTQLASLTTGAVVVLTMILLAPLFSDLPTAVLAAIIIQAVVSGMMDVPQMRRLYRVLRTDFWIAMIALVSVLTAGVLAGVVIGVFLSLGYLIYISASPAMPELGRKPGTRAFRSVDDEPEVTTYPGLLVMRIDSSLYFANSEAPEDRLRELVQDADPPIGTIVLDFEGINFIDSQASEAIGKVIDLAGYNDIDIRLARVKGGQVMRVLEADGVLGRLGTPGVYPEVYAAVEDLIEDETDARGPRSGSAEKTPGRKGAHGQH